LVSEEVKLLANIQLLKTTLVPADTTIQLLQAF
ncbi:MAG: hypothetical protein JWM28_3459, partial [Chitinophagaceae bacterium]|nr:hypothetical protein [Chitinophagaceae bacterium]